MRIYIQAEIKDSSGKTIKKTPKQLCHSYVTALIDQLAALMGYVQLSVMDTGGTPRTINRSNVSAVCPILICVAGAADITYGIAVGTSPSPVSIGDIKLFTIIQSGSTSGKLQYGTTSVGTPTTVGTSRVFTISRTFTNSSGNDITVEEVGLMVDTFDSAAAFRQFLVERSLFHLIIANGTSGTLTYTISATV